MQRRYGSIGCATFVLLLGGCGLNQSDGLIGESLPDLQGTMPVAVPTGETRGFARVDRATWEPMTIRVEQRQVETYPNYSPMWGFADTTARERNLAPTPMSALQEGGDNSQLAFEGVAAPFIWAFDLVAAPVRMVMRCPFSTVRQPEQPTTLVDTASH